MNRPKQSGLEMLQSIIDGQIPPPPMAGIIPMNLVCIEKGKAVFSAQADRNHLNPLGGVHGGFAATVLDSVTGCAIHSMVQSGEGYATLELNVKMLKPIPKDSSS